jgi:hypothetical protein
VDAGTHEGQPAWLRDLGLGLEKCHERWEEVKKKMAEEVAELDPTQASAWLTRTQWVKYLKGMEKTSLVRLMEKPEPEKEPVLKVIWQGVLEMARICQANMVARMGVHLRLAVVKTEPLKPRYLLYIPEGGR